MFRTRFCVRSAAVFAAVAFVLSLSGCGPKQRPYATVKGKITYNGKPVSAGNVYFVLLEDQEFTGGALLNSDGEFSALAPVGKVKLAVKTASLKPGGSGPPGGQASRPPGASGPPGNQGSRPPGGGGGPSGGSSGGSGPPPVNMDYAAKTGHGGQGDPQAKVGKYVPIPDKYETIETTDLEFDIKPGENDLGTIQLKGEIKK